MKYYEVDQDLGIDTSDELGWRGYYLNTAGHNIDELLDGAFIVEVDQDGGERDCYPLEDAPGVVQKAAERYLHRLVENYNVKRR